MREGVNFYGIMKDASGYGMATRILAKAFSESSVNTRFNFDYRTNDKDSYIKSLNNSDKPGDISFYVGPPLYRKINKNKYNISYFYWEADKLPTHWSKSIKSFNEIWVPCSLVESACRKGGFKGRIRMLPTPHDFFDYNNSIDKIDIPSQFSNSYYISDDVFKFYSIFQWHHRKGPDILLESYWKTFGRRDKVVLILKVNSLKVKGYSNSRIKSDISKIKTRLNLKYYAPVYVIDDILHKKYIKSLHDYSDCYVSPHRGEGWGIPIHDAILHKNPVIVTKYGGISEHLREDSAGIIKHNLAQVRNMEWSPSIYNKSQRWAEPKSDSLSFLMRDVYNNFDIYKKKSLVASRIINNFSINNVSKIIDRYICEIYQK